MGRREDLNDSEWLKKWFVKIFEKSKNFDHETKEKIEKLEKKTLKTNSKGLMKRLTTK